MPLKLCRPLSTPPMREPRPPASTTPVMSAGAMASTSDMAHLDSALAGAGVGRHGAAQLRIAVGAALPDVRDGRRELFVGRAAADERAEVVPLRRKEAQVQLAFGGQACAVAIAAEGLRHAADHAD